MRKGASRNMQRIGLKVTAGIAPPESGSRPAPFYKQMHSLEMRRLARIRYLFELEQEIQSKLDAGESVGLLREKLLGVRNGSLEPPRYDDAKVTGNQRYHGVRHDTQRRGEGTAEDHRRLFSSDRQVKSDLRDLAKGKLTMTSIAAVKGLLERFDLEFVAGTLSLTTSFLEKVTSSPAYVLAPPMSPADGLRLATVLEQHAPNAEPETAVEPIASSAAAASMSRKYISVDAITGNQFLKLRAAGWTLSGARMYPPHDWKG